MPRVFIALLVACLCSARLASAAAISLAGADCGTPDLLGLTFTANELGTLSPATGSVACPGVAIGAILGPSGSPLYGPVTSIGFTISDPGQLDGGLLILPGSQLTEVRFTPTGFIVSGGPIGDCVTFTTFDAVGVHPCADVAIRISGFDPFTTFAVTSVNEQAVPEPGTLSLLVAGTVAGLIRRSRRRSQSS